jgi:alpha-galactosidase
MARKVVFIGAGSIGFTRTVVSDLLTYPEFEDATLALVDIHKGRLDLVAKCCQKIIDAKGVKAKIVTSTKRREVMKGADAILTTILSGDTKVWQHDILIPKKYGIDINVGDTRGPAAVFRFLRTIPEMFNICDDIRELCPKAIFLNYTNPMAMLCHAMQRKYPDLAISGLCHSVQGTSAMLAKWVGLKGEDIDYVCAGINHMAYYLKFESKGKDLYPKIRKAITGKKDIYNAEQVRNEMFLALGYYVTESSGHNSEYNWWFRKRKDLIKKYCTKGTNWNPGHHAYILNEYRKREKTWMDNFKKWLKEGEVRMERSHEYASAIMNAWVGGGDFKFNGNVSNTNIITNIPQGACVEVPVLASRNRLEPIHVGALPIQLTALMGISATNEMMAVEGSITGNPELVYQSIAHDPLTATMLSLQEARKLTKEMFTKNKKYLPQFKKIKL